LPVSKKKKNAKIVTITLGKGIKALYDYKNKIVVTYMFSTKKYTMKQAKDWISKHKRSAASDKLLEYYAMYLVFKAEISDFYNKSEK
jgi:hypothetical protein